MTTSMGSRMCNYCRRNLPSADLCGCEGEKASRLKIPECRHRNTSIGFGLAGGGYGAYEVCTDCGHIIEKWQEGDDGHSR